VKPEVDMELPIIFQLPNKPHKTFNPAYNIKQLFSTWIKHDESIAIHSLIDENLLYWAHETFPMKEPISNNFSKCTQFPNAPPTRTS